MLTYELSWSRLQNYSGYSVLCSAEHTWPAIDQILKAFESLTYLSSKSGCPPLPCPELHSDSTAVHWCSLYVRSVASKDLSTRHVGQGGMYHDSASFLCQSRGWVGNSQMTASSVLQSGSEPCRVCAAFSFRIAWSVWTSAHCSFQIIGPYWDRVSSFYEILQGLDRQLDRFALFQLPKGIGLFSLREGRVESVPTAQFTWAWAVGGSGKWKLGWCDFKIRQACQMLWK